MMRLMRSALGIATNVLLATVAIVVIAGVVILDLLVMAPSAFDRMMKTVNGFQIAGASSVVRSMRTLPQATWLALGATMAAVVIVGATVLVLRRKRGARRDVAQRGFEQRRIQHRARPATTKTGLKVIGLATRGESRAEIARRTGLSQDTVRMVLDSTSERRRARPVERRA